MRELEADVFEELDDQHQLEFIEERSDEEVATVLARMAPDDAADLIAEFDEERRDAVLLRCCQRASGPRCARCSATTRRRAGG